MKTLPLLLILVSFAMGQRPAQPRNRQVLLDFRLERGRNPPRITAATEKLVFSKMFRRYLTDVNKCNPNFDASTGSDPLEAARKAGQIVPWISDVITGSFSAAGQSQTLYVISVNECNASHADNFGTKRVAIFSGRQLVADLDVDFKNGIARKTDLNNDGVDELLMTTGDIAQGTLVQMAALVSFQDGRLQVIHEFGTVVEDSCASGFPGSNAQASVLYISNAAPGKMPKFTMDNYVSDCRNTKRWRFVSSGKMQ